MTAIYDVFKKGPDGYVWVEAVEGFENARTRVRKLTRLEPGEYVYDLRRKIVVRQVSEEEPVRDAALTLHS